MAETDDFPAWPDGSEYAKGNEVYKMVDGVWKKDHDIPKSTAPKVG